MTPACFVALSEAKGLHLLLLLLFPLTLAAQTHTDLIRGRVQDDSGRAIASASVIATRAPDRAVFQSSTDSAGTYTVVVREGTGDYLVYFSAPGRKPFRQRVTRAPASPPDTIFVVNATLAPAVAQQLAAVRVSATKPKPTRSPDAGTHTGAAEAVVDYFTGAVPPDLAGNIAAMSATIPGITPVNGGISVLGLDPSQNTTTLNGMALGTGALPRAARTTTRVSTTAYDPARGWFGGANSNVEFSGGGVYKLRDATATIDAPALQYTDALSSQLGRRFTNVDASVGGSGPIGNKDLYFYSYGLQGGHSSRDVVSLLSSDVDALSHAGVASDSVARLQGILGALKFPTSFAMPNALTTDRLSFLARFDRSQVDARTFVAPKRASAVTFFGNASRTAPLNLGITSLPTRASRAWDAVGGTQAMFSTYFGNDYLATMRSALTVSLTHSAPYLDLPGALINVSSILPSGEGGIASLAFGGGGQPRDSRRVTWESIGDVQLYATGRESHRLGLTTDVRLDGFSDELASDLGTYSFNSLAQLEANQPASFSRSLLSPARRGGEWNAFAAIGDLWRVSPNLRVQYGARLEGNAFTSGVPYNNAVSQAFGVRNDAAPSQVHVSPRLGFTWVRRGGGNNGAIAFNKLGAYNMGPDSYVRGGIGEFRSMLSPTLLSDASVMTGLPGSTRRIACVGSAVPAPDWSTYLSNPGAIPTQCVGGSSSSLADTAPVVRIVDPNFSPARSWRANMSYASQIRAVTYSIDGTYSLNLDQPGVTDLNFRNTPAFTTGDDGRPVFVPAAAIVPASGALSATAARVTPAFGPVLAGRSDLRSVSRQLILTAAPDLYGSDSYWMSVSYVLASTRALQSGFDGTTFDSPLTRTWDRGALDSRHQFVLRGGYSAHGVTFTALGRLMSGLPFTPIVSGDVNGDGFINDRAFIVDASSASAPLAPAMTTLLASSSSAVRDCLLRQQNTPAGRNSCEGPWTTSLNAQLTLDLSRFKIPHVRVMHINLTNPLGGLDQVLHGSGGLRGWGTQPAPDPILYYVRGFNAGTQRFQYEVNPRFGATDAARSTLRAPFRATIDFAFSLTPDVAQQQLERYLGPGRAGRPGPKLTVADLMQRYARNVGDPYQAILRETDSLLLSRPQVEALQAAGATYRQKMDSLWHALATEFAGFGDHYDVRAAVKRQEDAIADGNEVTRLHIRATLGDILTPIQLRLMPYARLYRTEKPVTSSGRTLYQ